MDIPAVPLSSGHTVEGRVSWFGGPHDGTDSGHTASGATTATPGIAVYNRATLGGYWRVTDTKTGRSVVLKQTDLGPAPWTGRKIDVTYSALNRFGYGEHNFPTDSTFKAEYLGHTPAAPAAPAATTSARPPAARAVPSLPGVQLDQAAYQQAQRQALVGKLMASLGGDTRENPLFASGLLSTKTPNPSEYTRATPAPPQAASAPGRPPAAPAPGAGGKLGGFLPGNAQLHVQRVDQGQDIQTNPGGPIIAPGDGVVVAVNDNPGGFGERYPVVKFTTGPLAGRTVYIGHTHSALNVGDHFKAGQPLSHTGYGTPKEGNARTPGWAEIGLWGPSGPLSQGAGATPAGKQIARLIGGGR